jgi:hypothetical protein
MKTSCGIIMETTTGAEENHRGFMLIQPTGYFNPYS